MTESTADVEATEDLTDPITALDYLGIDRMKLLVLRHGGKPPLIRLLDARKLFNLVLCGRRWDETEARPGE